MGFADVSRALAGFTEYGTSNTRHAVPVAASRSSDPDAKGVEDRSAHRREPSCLRSCLSGHGTGSAELCDIELIDQTAACNIRIVVKLDDIDALMYLPGADRYNLPAGACC